MRFDLDICLVSSGRNMFRWAPEDATGGQCRELFENVVCAGEGTVIGVGTWDSRIGVGVRCRRLGCS